MNYILPTHDGVGIVSEDEEIPIEDTDHTPFTLGEIRAKFDLISFMESVDLGAYIVDTKRNIIFWNKKAAEITGYSAEEIIGTRCQDNLLKHEDRMGLHFCPNNLCPLSRTMRVKRSLKIPYTVYAYSKMNKKLPISIITFPLIYEGVVMGGVELFELVDPVTPDMNMAMTIQKLLIPSKLPENIEVFYYPADYIGGDLIMVNDNWSCIVDVSGHGVSSALISSGLRVIIGEVLTADLPVQDLGNILEERFKEFGNVDMFFTGIFVKNAEGGVEIVSFGHPAPFKIAGDKVEIIDVHYDVLIGWGKTHSSVYRFEPLYEGESILLYSDGLTEITTDGNFIGEKGVMEILSEVRHPKEIYIRAMELSDEDSHKDDISLVVINGIASEV
jgi:hypothetical protein